jgi:oxysterol-binding protein-related protein 3/6/7
LKIDLFQKAANTEDPVLRLTYAFIAFNTIYSMVKLRKRKPFNPMLGETYEFVTDKIKYVSEKVQH